MHVAGSYHSFSTSRNAINARLCFNTRCAKGSNVSFRILLTCVKRRPRKNVQMQVLVSMMGKIECILFRASLLPTSMVPQIAQVIDSIQDQQELSPTTVSRSCLSCQAKFTLKLVYNTSSKQPALINKITLLNLSGALTVFEPCCLGQALLHFTRVLLRNIHQQQLVSPSTQPALGRPPTSHANCNTDTVLVPCLSQCPP